MAPFPRPRGRAPNDKRWDETTGKWHDKKADPADSADSAGSKDKKDIARENSVTLTSEMLKTRSHRKYHEIHTV